jgi:hypothetical protein
MVFIVLKYIPCISEHFAFKYVGSYKISWDESRKGDSLIIKGVRYYQWKIDTR